MAKRSFFVSGYIIYETKSQFSMLQKIYLCEHLTFQSITEQQEFV